MAATLHTGLLSDKSSRERLSEAPRPKDTARTARQHTQEHNSNESRSLHAQESSRKLVALMGRCADANDSPRARPARAPRSVRLRTHAHDARDVAVETVGAR